MEQLVTSAASELTPKQRKAILALITEGNHTQAAEAAGITRQTLQRYLKQEHFRDALNKAFNDYRDQLIIHTATYQSKAFETLHNFIEGNEATRPEKLRAIDMLLDHSDKIQINKPKLLDVVEIDPAELKRRELQKDEEEREMRRAKRLADMIDPF